MSKKKTNIEMRAIAEMIKAMVKDWDEDEEKEPDPCENCEVHYCNDCPHWRDDDEDEEDNEDEAEEEEDEDEEESDTCEGHEIYGCSDEDCYSCKGSKENTQTEELSKFIISVNTVLGSDMGLLVFDKSNKKDMERIAAIFGEYAKRL